MIPFPSVITTAERPVKACMPICEPFPEKSEKYQPQGIQGLNRRFEKGVKRGGQLQPVFFLLVKQVSIHASNSSMVSLPSVHSSRLVMAVYFHSLNFSSVI